MKILMTAIAAMLLLIACERANNKEADMLNKSIS
jgi:hypothetical protein